MAQNSSYNILPDPTSGSLWLVIPPWGTSSRAASEILLDLVARLVFRGSVRVVDGNNRFDAHYCSRLIARNLHAGLGREVQGKSLADLLGRIYIARAFTCYQMLTLLGEIPAGNQPGNPPTLVMDFLATFYDENVSVGEARRLLDVCLAHLRRLGRYAPVLVSTRPAPSEQLTCSRDVLLEALMAVADRTWRLEAPSPSVSQLSLPLPGEFVPASVVK